MAQEVADFTSLDDLDRLFCSFWPKFTDSTKTALLSELRPYLRRCAALLPELEPHLFRTKASKEQFNPSSSTQASSLSAPASSALPHARELPPTSPTPASPRLTSQPDLPAQSLSTTRAPPPPLQPKYLSGLPEDVARTLLRTSASAFFRRNGKSCTEHYQAMVQSHDRLWLTVIEQRFRYLGLCKLRNRIEKHGHGDVFYYTANSAKRKIADVAALYNPTLSRQKINKDIDQYLARGKMYLDFMQEFSISTVVGLDPGYMNFYERRKTIEQYRTFISDLKRDGARPTVELAQLPESAKALETTAQRYLDWICADYWVWMDGPKRKYNLDNAEAASGSDNCHSEANKRRRKLPPDSCVTEAANAVFNGEPLHGSNAVDSVPQSANLSQFRSLDVLADTALLGQQVDTFPSQTYETHPILLPTANPLPTQLVSNYPAANHGDYAAASRMQLLSDRRPTDMTLHNNRLCASTVHQRSDSGRGLCSDDANITSPSNITTNVDTDINDIHHANFTGADFGLNSGNSATNSVDVYPTLFTGADSGLNSGNSATNSVDVHPTLFTGADSGLNSGNHATNSTDVHPTLFTGADFGLNSGNRATNSADVHPTLFTGADFGLNSCSDFGQNFITNTGIADIQPSFCDSTERRFFSGDSNIDARRTLDLTRNASASDMLADTAARVGEGGSSGLGLSLDGICSSTVTPSHPPQDTTFLIQQTTLCGSCSS